MEIANNEVLRLSRSLSARGIVDLFESRKYAPKCPNERERSEFYQRAFSSDKRFRREVEERLGRISKKTVGTLAVDLYASVTSNIPKSTRFGCEVIIFSGRFQKDQLHLLEAISAYLPVSARVINTVPEPILPTDDSFLAQMKSKNRQVLILFGSQNGAAEDLADRLAKDLHRYGKKPLVMDPDEIDVKDLPKITEIQNALLILCVATYEGGPTDNARSLVDFITNNDSDFTGLSFAIFGLGDKNYEHFNEVGKVLDKRLEELGAKRVFELGLGDNDDDIVNLEWDFRRWREALLPSLAETFGWQLVEQD